MSGGPSEITLQWDAVTCADGYRVEYSQLDRDGCQPIDSSSASVITHCSCQTTSTTIPDLDSYSLYLVRVRALMSGTYAPVTTREVRTGISSKILSSSLRWFLSLKFFMEIVLKVWLVVINRLYHSVLISLVVNWRNKKC